jgi:multidrug efflux pump subunit AcrA (membrane-fusion protein)
MNESNKRELRLVRVGDDVGSDGVAILSGLRAGERVVVRGMGDGESKSTWQ